MARGPSPHNITAAPRPATTRQRQRDRPTTRAKVGPPAIGSLKAMETGKPPQPSTRDQRHHRGGGREKGRGPSARLPPGNGGEWRSQCLKLALQNQQGLEPPIIEGEVQLPTREVTYKRTVAQNTKRPPPHPGQPNNFLAVLLNSCPRRSRRIRFVSAAGGEV